LLGILLKIRLKGVRFFQTPCTVRYDGKHILKYIQDYFVLEIYDFGSIPLSRLTTKCFSFYFLGSSSSILHKLTLINFIYLLVFSGLEFTLTFLTHERFNFTRLFPIYYCKYYIFDGWTRM